MTHQTFSQHFFFLFILEEKEQFETEYDFHRKKLDALLRKAAAVVIAVPEIWDSFAYFYEGIEDHEKVCRKINTAQLLVHGHFHEKCLKYVFSKLLIET